MPLLTFFRARQYLIDARQAPLTVTDERSDALRQELQGLAVKPFMLLGKLVELSKEVWLLAGLAVIAAPIVIGAFAGPPELASYSFLVNWTALVAATYGAASWVGSVLSRAERATLLMSEAPGDDCAWALLLVKENASAKALHAQLLQASVPLRMFHYDAFQALNDADLRAERERRDQDSKRRMEAARQRSCRELHGLPEPTDRG